MWITSNYISILRCSIHQSLVATRQFETGNARLPACCAGKLPGECVVLVDIPECAIIHGVNIERGVVAPTGVGCALHTRAVDDRALAQSHLSQWVAAQAASVAYAWEDSCPVDNAIAERDIALFVLCDASHPAMHSVAWVQGPLLVN